MIYYIAISFLSIDEIIFTRKLMYSGSGWSIGKFSHQKM